ncbi:fasciclin domain-containing protein [Acaryochloris sp. CCMEE 5410]|uniref:fasciclin domain-containing protein n=1 Tax=Acaryochloris sp. CCMEE 5410 TaxID=310037 RepID=UPI0002483D6A|nr:fasciclin domain-containing protein [Acaryochloris sp. CCMEE 5410]KAI9131238.1 fasciclin domain-containing protein [Acaryochloris sp. CCMEE 5410]
MKTKCLSIVSLFLLATTTSIGSASAQTSGSEAPAELSPAIMKILCKNFPLNSRCTGEAAPAAAEDAVEETAPEAAEETAPEAAEETAPEGEMDSEAPEGEMDSEAPSSEVEDSSDAASTDGTIVEVASANDSFKTLVAAIKAAELAETLSGEGPFTVFAPTEEAFAALPAGTVDTLLKPENKDKLVKILTYHVVPAKAVSTDLESGDVSTVAGAPVKVTVESGAVTVNNANVVQADVMGSNGVIHVIDKVLLPPDL